MKVKVNYISKNGKGMVLSSVYDGTSLVEAKLLIPFPVQEGQSVEVDLSSASVDDSGFIRGAKFPVDKEHLPDGVIMLGGNDDGTAVDPDTLFD